MFEHHSKPLISLSAFVKRMSASILIAVGFTGMSLVIGILGYRWFEGYSWIDCFLNAAMILGGMGEVNELKTNAGKAFAGMYAMYSGLWVVACMGLILAPVFHRMMHHFHTHRPPPDDAGSDGP